MDLNIFKEKNDSGTNNEINIKTELINGLSEFLMEVSASSGIESQQNMKADIVELNIKSENQDPCDQFDENKQLEDDKIHFLNTEVNIKPEPTDESDEMTSKYDTKDSLDVEDQLKDLRNIPGNISLENVNVTEEENTEHIVEEYPLETAEEKLQESQEDDESNKQNQKPKETTKKKYSCHECEKICNSRQSLHHHLKIHSGVKPSHQKCHKCHICEKSFSLLGNLNAHIIMHTGEKPYICEICNKAFTQSAYLTTHKLIHSDIKPFTCDHCDKQFFRKDSLNQHIRTHTGEKPYKCDVCGRTFAQNSGYNVHKRIHTGEKPYKCNICNKSFKQIPHLKTHKQLHNTIDDD